MLYRALQNHQHHRETAAAQPGDVIRFNYVNEVLFHCSLCSQKEKYICVLKSSSQNCDIYVKFERLSIMVQL